MMVYRLYKDDPYEENPGPGLVHKGLFETLEGAKRHKEHRTGCRWHTSEESEGKWNDGREWFIVLEEVQA